MILGLPHPILTPLTHHSFALVDRCICLLEACHGQTCRELTTYYIFLYIDYLQLVENRMHVQQEITKHVHTPIA